MNLVMTENVFIHTWVYARSTGAEKSNLTHPYPIRGIENKLPKRAAIAHLSLSCLKNKGKKLWRMSCLPASLLTIG